VVHVVSKESRWLVLPRTSCLYIMLLIEYDGHFHWWSLCHYGMVCPQVVDGRDGLQSERVAANVMNK
jgi:hypothetical protein